MTRFTFTKTAVRARRTVVASNELGSSRYIVRLDVTVSFMRAIPFTEAIEINVYDSFHNMVGQCDFEYCNRSKTRKLKFDIWGDGMWLNDTYLMVFHRNGQPLWFSYVRFDEDMSQVAEAPLLEVEDVDALTRYINRLAPCDDEVDFSKPSEPEKSAEEEIADDETTDDEPIDDELAEEDYTVGGPVDDEPLEEGKLTKLQQVKDKIFGPTPRQKLDSMIGLSSVKHELDEALTMVRFRQRRESLGLPSDGDNRNHMIFLGNPGTGKTTVARLIGEIYHDLGLLSRGHTVEMNRTSLVGEYIGETEHKVAQAIEDAKGGVLFIDEAYTLIERGKGSNDFGKEVLNALLPILAEPNPDIIVILAGYDDKMMSLLRFNQGLPDRFPVRLHFDDYDASQLCQIAESMLQERHFTLTDAARQRLADTARKAIARRGQYFGNARWVRNLVEHGIIRSMARRCMLLSEEQTTQETLSRVEECDVEEAAAAMTLDATMEPTHRAVGFTASMR